MTGHALDSVDWTQAHEWVLLVLVLLGVYTLVSLALRAAVWGAAIVRERREARRARAAAEGPMAARDATLAAALNRIADVLESIEQKEAGR